MQVIEGMVRGEGLRVGIVASRFNSAIVEHLVDGAADALRRHGVSDSDITLVWAPGAFELPVLALELAETATVDAVVCLGAVIRGATDHYTFVAGEAAKGVADVARSTRIPVIFGILTTDTIEQAVERSGTKAGNKGVDCALSAIEAVNVLREIRRLAKA